MKEIEQLGSHKSTVQYKKGNGTARASNTTQPQLSKAKPPTKGIHLSPIILHPLPASLLIRNDKASPAILSMSPRLLNNSLHLRRLLTTESNIATLLIHLLDLCADGVAVLVRAAAGVDLVHVVYPVVWVVLRV